LLTVRSGCELGSDGGEDDSASQPVISIAAKFVIMIDFTSLELSKAKKSVGAHARCRISVITTGDGVEDVNIRCAVAGRESPRRCAREISGAGRREVKLIQRISTVGDASDGGASAPSKCPNFSNWY